MNEELMRMITENFTNIALTVVASVTSAVLYRLNQAGKTIERTGQEVEEVKHHVNGSLSARLSNMTHNILSHIDTRLDIIEARMRGVEVRVDTVEKGAEACRANESKMLGGLNGKDKSEGIEPGIDQ